MRLSIKQLKHFSVETASGAKLGHVYDIVLEIEGQLIAQYVVKSSMISSEKYLINREQILRFEDKKIIVEDSVVREKEVEEAETKAKVSPEPA